MSKSDLNGERSQCRYTGLSYCSVTYREAGIPACCTEMVKPLRRHLLRSRSVSHIRFKFYAFPGTNNVKNQNIKRAYMSEVWLCKGAVKCGMVTARSWFQQNSIAILVSKLVSKILHVPPGCM